MKSLLVTALAFGCIGASSLRAEGDAVQAAVVAQATNAELRTTTSIRADGRRSFAEGEVHAVAGASGRFIELKVDGTHVALLPPAALRIRTCTAAELTQAQAKFNVLANEIQRTARKEISSAKRQAKSQARANAQCSTCPVVQAGAQAEEGAARKAYMEKKKTLRLKNQALAKEALAWAAAGPAPTAN